MKKMVWLLIGLLCVTSSYAYHPNETTKVASNVGMIIVPTEALVISLLKEDYQGSKQFAFAFAGTLALTQTLKTVVDEERPSHKSCGSFPSGHAAWAFSGATYLHRRYGLPLAIPAYAMATGVAVARVRANRHYWHDVIAGAGVAAFNTIIFVKPLHKTEIQLALQGKDNAGVFVTLRYPVEATR